MMAGHFITVLMSTVWGHGQDRVFVYVCARVGAWGEGNPVQEKSWKCLEKSHV